MRVMTWVADFRRAFSLRRYRFVRAADGEVLAKGETDWVFVDVARARPRSVPEELKALFEVAPVKVPVPLRTAMVSSSSLRLSPSKSLSATIE